MSTTDLLEVDDLDAATLHRVIERALAWKREPASVPVSLLSGMGVAALFEKPSARTRSSIEMAVATLGGHPIYIRPEEVRLDERETVEDVARTLAGYCQVICARVFDHRTLERMVSAVEVPVVNLLSDRAHPMQALADLLTVREHFGDVAGRRLAFIGDGNNVAASLAFAAALSGLEMTVSSPTGFELDTEVLRSVRSLGVNVELVADPVAAVAGADVVYTDVWTSMGQEAEAEQRRAAFAGFSVDEALMAAASPEAVFMHCLPAHRGEEVAGAVIDGPRSLVWPQAANRMHSARSLLAELDLAPAGWSG